MSSTAPGTAIPETWGLLINFLSWFLIVTSFMAVLTRMVTKYFVRRKLSNDDWAIISSLVRLIPGLSALLVANNIPLGSRYRSDSGFEFSSCEWSWNEECQSFRIAIKCIPKGIPRWYYMTSIFYTELTLGSSLSTPPVSSGWVANVPVRSRWSSSSWTSSLLDSKELRM